jgi:hypothetical protein
MLEVLKLVRALVDLWFMPLFCPCRSGGWCFREVPLTTRLFSKDPLSWGQMFFLWVGGLLVVAVPVIAMYPLADKGVRALVLADSMDIETARQVEGLPEDIFEWEDGRITELIPPL